MQYYGSAVIPQLAFAYLFYKALSVLAALQETTEVKLYLGVSPCKLGGGWLSQHCPPEPAPILLNQLIF